MPAYPVITFSPAFNAIKTQRFNTIAQETAAAQGSVYVAPMTYPVWDFKISLPYLQGRMDDPSSPIAQLSGAFNAAKGRAGVWLYLDPRDNTVTNYQFATGDGATKIFPLLRPIGSAGKDLVQNVTAAPTIKVDGVTKTVTTDYTIDSKGVVTFVTAPANTKPITWTGTFYFLCRWKADSWQDLAQFFTDAWTISTLEFESVIL